MKFVFFGSSQFSIYVLNELKTLGFLPELIVTVPDKPKGRKLLLTPNIVKIWAQDNNIKILDPATLKNNLDLTYNLKANTCDLFLVSSYGKIIPKEIFEIPKFKTLNIHPSLLPKYRGASPIISQILNDEQNMGVSIMQIDEGMDTGSVLTTSPLTPLLSKERGKILNSIELEKILAEEGARLFTEVAFKWIRGEIEAKSQDESQATYSHKIKKEDGLLDLNDEPFKNLLKIKAYSDWPRSYFFTGRGGKNIRVIVTDAEIDESGKLKLLRVIPEGKSEMSYEDFLRGNR